MPLTIWKPMQHKDGFTKMSEKIYSYKTNGAVADPPFDKDTKVAEITRFEGWTTECFCDVGEFEITTRDVKPEQVTRDNLIFFDGRIFCIEDYEWERDDAGYICTISGRDVWKYLESQYHQTRTGNQVTVTGGSIESDILLGLISPIQKVGWLADRSSISTIVYEIEGMTSDDFKAKEAKYTYKDVYTNGARLRIEANLFDVGIIFSAGFDSDSGLFYVIAKIKGKKDNGLVINTKERGVSSFKYSYSSRSEVNGTFAYYESPPLMVQITEEDGTVFYPYRTFELYDEINDAYVDNFSLEYKHPISHAVNNEGAKNYFEIANRYSERFINLGKIPEDISTSYENNAVEGKKEFVNWLETEIMDGYTKPEKIVSFTYDNNGRFKYGKDFTIGDRITIIDDFLGIESKQLLTGVKKSFKAGEAVSYEFTFGDKTVKQSDVLKKRFETIDRRTFGTRMVK